MMTDVEGGEKGAVERPSITAAVPADHVPTPSTPSSRFCAGKITWACTWGVLVVIGQAFIWSTKDFLRKVAIAFGCSDEDGPDCLSNLSEDALALKKRTKAYFEKMKEEVDGLTGGFVGPIAHVDMQKGETRRLDVSIKKIRLGLGWSPKGPSTDRLDLDASCIMLHDINGRIETSNVCYFGQRECVGVSHLGDDTSGVKGEVICIDLEKIQDHIICLAFTINVWTAGKSFEDVGKAHVRLFSGAEDKGGAEYCRCELNVAEQADSDKKQGSINVAEQANSGKKQGFMWCTLTRATEPKKDIHAWNITMVCEHFSGSLARDALKSPDLPPGILSPKRISRAWELFHESIPNISKQQAAAYQQFYSLAKNNEALSQAVDGVIHALSPKDNGPALSENETVLSGARRLFHKACDEKMLDNASYVEHFKIFFGFCLATVVPFHGLRVSLLHLINGTDENDKKRHTNRFVIDMTTQGLASSTKWADEREKTRSTYWYLALSNVKLVVLMMSNVLPLILLSAYNLTLNVGTKDLVSCTTTSAAFAAAMNATASALVGIPSDADFSVPCPQVYLPYSPTTPESAYSPFVTAGGQCLGLYHSYYSRDANRWQSTSQFVCYFLLLLLCQYMIEQQKEHKAISHFCVRYKAVYLYDCESQAKASFLAADEEYITGLGPLLPDKPAQAAPASDASAAPDSRRSGYSAPPAQYDQRGVVWFVDVLWHRVTPKAWRYNLKTFLTRWSITLCLGLISCLYVASLISDPIISSVWYVFSDRLLPPGKEQRFYQTAVASTSRRNPLQSAMRYHVETCSPALNAFPPVKLVYSTSKREEESNPITALVQGLLFFSSAYGLVKAKAAWFDWVDTESLFVASPEERTGQKQLAASNGPDAPDGSAKGVADEVVPYYDYPSFRDKALSPLMVQDSLWANKHLRFAYWLYKTHGPDSRPALASAPGDAPDGIDTSCVPKEAWEKLRYELFQRTDFNLIQEGGHSCWGEDQFGKLAKFDSNKGDREYCFRGLIDFIRVTNHHYFKGSYRKRQSSSAVDFVDNPMTTRSSC